MKNYLCKIYICLTLIAVFTFQISAQQKNEILAKAGSVVISKDEFYKRYEFTPHLKTKTARDLESTKRDLLLTMIGEKLLAQSAIAEKIDKSRDYLIMMQYLRNIYLRDALYKIEVKDKVVLPDSDVKIGRKRILKTLKSKFIFSAEEKESRSLYSSLMNGASFDSLLQTRPEKDEQNESEEITFGTMNKKLEDVIFDLMPGDITPPVKLAEGWYICKVYSVTEKKFLEDQDKRNVDKVISGRIEDDLYEAFYKKFFKGVNVTADRSLFELLLKTVSNYVNENKILFKEKRNNKFRLVEKDVYAFKPKMPAASLDSVFIKTSENPITLSQFLDYFMLQGFELERLDEAYIRNRLNSFVKTFIQNELLAREALKRGYDKLPDVAVDLKSWSDFYLSRLMMKNAYTEDPVSDEEARAFFIKSSGSVPQDDKVKIAEILVNDLQVVEKILNELDKGKDFKELAKKYTLRDSVRNKGGVFDYFSINENGEIGKAAARMKVGDIFGPIKTAEGYSIIKLLDKKEGKNQLFKNFEEAKDEIKGYIHTEKLYKRINGEAAKLALDYGVEINDAQLRAVNVTKINMVVFRRFGFGGQLIAAPYAPDFSSWYKEYEDMKKKLSL